MNVELINNCKKSYRPDPLRISRKILDKIPGKYLVGLGEIVFFDESSHKSCKYIIGKKNSKLSRIEIYIGNLTNTDKFSLFDFNILLNTTIVEHVIRYLQPGSNDKDILSFRMRRYKADWLYLGLWSPLLIPIYLNGYVYKKAKFYREFLKKQTTKLLNYIDKKYGT